MAYGDREYDSVDLGEAELVHATSGALLLLLDVDGEEHWVPRSVISEDESDDIEGDGSGTLFVFEWWAVKSGLAE